MQVLQNLAEGVLVGPLLLGTRLPAHVLQYGSSVESVVHLTATGTVQAAGMRQEA
jgi:phosphotransacetylase